jgi:hypothetical protein
VHAVCDVDVRPEDGQLVEELDGACAGAGALEVVEALPLRAVPRPRRLVGEARRQLAGLGRGLAQVDVEPHAQLARDVRQVEQRTGAQRVRRVRADAKLRHAHGADVVDSLQQVFRPLALPVLVVPVHHLPVGDAVHALGRERVGRLHV